jgi:hypothetical protein
LEGGGRGKREVGEGRGKWRVEWEDWERKERDWQKWEMEIWRGIRERDCEERCHLVEKVGGVLENEGTLKKTALKSYYTEKVD